MRDDLLRDLFTGAAVVHRLLFDVFVSLRFGEVQVFHKSGLCTAYQAYFVDFCENIVIFLGHAAEFRTLYGQELDGLNEKIPVERSWNYADVRCRKLVGNLGRNVVSAKQDNSRRGCRIGSFSEFLTK